MELCRSRFRWYLEPGNFVSCPDTTLIGFSACQRALPAKVAYLITQVTFLPILGASLRRPVQLRGGCPSNIRLALFFPFHNLFDLNNLGPTYHTLGVVDLLFLTYLTFLQFCELSAVSWTRRSLLPQLLLELQTMWFRRMTAEIRTTDSRLAGH